MRGEGSVVGLGHCFDMLSYGQIRRKTKIHSAHFVFVSQMFKVDHVTPKHSLAFHERENRCISVDAQRNMKREKLPVLSPCQSILVAVKVYAWRKLTTCQGLFNDRHPCLQILRKTLRSIMRRI